MGNAREVSQVGRESPSEVQDGAPAKEEGAAAMTQDWKRRLLPVAVLAALVGALYWQAILDLVHAWETDDNYSHGFLVPVFSAYLVWKDREELRALAPRGSWLGLPIILLGLGALVLGEIGAEFFTSRCSLILLLGGLIMFHLGWDFLKVLAFPLLFLLFAIPLPAIVFNAVAFPLQQIAARNAAWTLELLSIPVFLDGNVIHLSHNTLGVTEACSGIRSMVSLLTLAMVWAYVALNGVWSKVVLVASAIPITMAANSLRVIVTAVIAQLFGMEYAEGFYHDFAGWLIFLVAFAGLLCVHGLITLLQRKPGNHGPPTEPTEVKA